MWDAFDGVNLTAVRLVFPVVDWLGPPLVGNVVLQLVHVLVTADTNDLDFVSPCCSMLFEHLLVVCHGSLAWWAPSSPEVNKQHFTFIMLNIDWRFGILKSSHIFYHFVLVSWREHN